MGGTAAGMDMAAVRNLLLVVAVRTSLVGVRARGVAVGSSFALCIVGSVDKGDRPCPVAKTYRRRCRRSWLGLGLRREDLERLGYCRFGPSAGRPFDPFGHPCCPFDSNWTCPVHEHRPSFVNHDPFRSPHRPLFDRCSSHYCSHSPHRGQFG